MGGVRVTCAEADLVESAWEMTVTVTVAGEGTAEGGVYTPPAEIVPTVELPPDTPFTHQVTVESSELLMTAVKVSVAPPASRLALVGLIATETGLGHPSVLTAVAGAAVVAEVGDTTTSAVSSRPASSVT